MPTWFELMEEMVDALDAYHAERLENPLQTSGRSAALKPCPTHRPTGAVVTPDADKESGCPDGFDLETWFNQLDDPDQE